jgi:hypothetical protein
MGFGKKLARLRLSTLCLSYRNRFLDEAVIAALGQVAIVIPAPHVDRITRTEKFTGPLVST